MADGGQLPSLQDYMTQAASAQGGGMPPPATGTGNPLTSGFMAGVYGAGQAIGNTAQAVGTLVGAKDFAQGAGQFAARQQATAQTYANPQYEQNPWSLGGVAYQAARGLPMLGATLAGEAVAGPLGAAGVGFVGGAGENVQAAKDANGGELSAGQAAGAAALGVPEAYLSTLFPQALHGDITHGVVGSLGERVFKGAAREAAIQAPVAGATTALTQLMGDPNRPIADRAQEIVQSALSGAVQGGLFGGAVAGVRGVPQEKLDTSATNDQLKAATDVVKSPEPTPPEPEAPPATGEGMPAPTAPVVEPVTPPTPEPTGSLLAAEPEAATPVASAPEAVPTSTPVEAVVPAPEADPRATAQGADALPTPQEADADRAYVQSLIKTPRKMPTTLTDGQKQALQAELIDRANNNKPFTRVAKLAADNGLLDAQGVPIGAEQMPTPEEQPQARELGADQPGQLVGRDVPLESFKTPAAKQAVTTLRTAAEKLLGYSLSDPDMLALKSRMDDVETKLLAGKPAITAAKTLTKEINQRVAREEALAKTKAAFTKDAPAEAALEPTVPSVEPPAPVGRTQAEAETLKAPATAVPVETPPSPEAQAIGRPGRVLPDMTTPRYASLDHISDLDGLVSDARKGLKDVSRSVEAKGTGDAQAKNVAAINQSIGVHDDALSSIREAVNKAKDGDQSMLSQLSPTRSVPTELLDQHDTKMTPAFKAKVYAQSEREGKIMDQLERMQRPETPLVGASGPQRQADVDLQDGVSRGWTGKDVLQYLQGNGSNGFIKAYAALLSKAGVDPKVSFARKSGLAFDTDRANDPNASVPSSYNHALDRINVYDTAGMEQSLLHELTHAATMSALAKGGPAAAEANRLFEALKTRAPGSDLYGLANAREMVAEAISNPTFRDFLKEQRADTGSTLGNAWQAVKNFAFKALGMPQRMRGMYEQIMDTTNKLVEANQAAPGSNVETPSVVDHVMHGVAHKADQIKATAEKYGAMENVRPGIRAQLLGWMNLDHIAAVYKNLVPKMTDYIQGRRTEGVIKSSFNQMSVIADHAAKQLPKGARDLLNKSMQYTQLDIDPRKPWSDKIHDKLRSVGNASELQRAVSQANQDYNNLARVTGGAQAYAMRKAVGDAQLAAHSVLAMRETVANAYQDKVGGSFAVDHFGQWQFNDRLHQDPIAAATHWRGVADGMERDLQQYIAKEEQRAGQFKPAAKGQPKNPTSDSVKYHEIVDPLDAGRSVLSTASDYRSLLDGPPNFHLGRDGNFFVTAKLASDPTTKALDPGKVARIQKALSDAGFGDVVINADGDSNKFYTKVDTPAQMTRLHELMTQLHAGGVLDKGEPVVSGASNKVNIQKGVSPLWMQRLIGAGNASIPDLPKGTDPALMARYKEATDSMRGQMAQTWMNMLPDNSVKKIFMKRADVQGFNADMLSAATKRAKISSSAISGMSQRRAISEAMAGMKENIESQNENMGASTQQKLAAHQAVNELMTREVQKSWNVPTPGLDAIRRWTHLVEVGSSPGYVLTLMSQIGTLSLPQLGSTHGFLASSKALASNAALAFKVATAVAKGPGGMSFGMTRDSLENAGIDKGTVDFLMHQANRGDFNQSFTQQMTGDHGDGNVASKFAHGMGLYSEMYPRLITALAARDLYNAKGASNPTKYAGSNGFHQFVSDAVNNSQFTWDGSNNPRQTSKGGMFGAASPLVNQFMGFQIKMIEKLYRETHDAFAGDTPEDRAQARKFLAGHLAVVGLLAGTMGAPFAQGIAGAVDRLADLLTGKDNWDVNAQYRSFLSHTFGSQMGEIIAHGLPRAAGVDLSHLGDSKLLPFTQFLAEKRKFADAEADYLKSMAGSSVGLGVKYISAAQDLFNGDYMQAAIKFAPEIAEHPLEAIQLARRGYVDKHGMPEAIHASGKDIALEAAGIQPGDEAEYNEVNRTKQGAMALRAVRSQNINTHLERAYAQGNSQDYDYWLRQSMSYGMDHPGIAQPASGLSDTLRKDTRASAIGQAFQRPIGISPRDISTVKLTDYGNFPKQEQ